MAVTVAMADGSVVRFLYAQRWMIDKETGILYLISGDTVLSAVNKNEWSYIVV